jgi:hypothetical protein
MLRAFKGNLSTWRLTSFYRRVKLDASVGVSMLRPVPPFQAGVFKNLYETPLGQSLWACLTEEETRVRMQTASDLGRPAVEGIEELLLERFGEQILDDRAKQMVGRMTRQVMEYDGYVIDAQNIKLMSGAPFSRATRYRRRDAMTFHAWRLTTDPTSLALTSDKAGHRLPPPSDGAWQYWKSFEGRLRVCIGLGLQNFDNVRHEVAANGFYLHRLERNLGAST